jgi:quercetin dioxygenase-like cupin family protein
MAKIYTPEELPHLSSTRDKRKRIDLINESIHGTTSIKGDMIVYPPDNAGSAHYHKDAYEFKFVLRGSGTFHIGQEAVELRAGHIMFLYPGDVHFFETSPDEDLAFVEFWLPPPQETVWINPDDT